MKPAIIRSVTVPFLERDICAVYKTLTEEDPEIGRDPWVLRKIETGRVFSPAELAIVEAVSSRGALPGRIVEVGCGYGGMSLLLSAIGCPDVTAIEGAPRRAVAAAETVRRLRGKYGLDGCKVVHGYYPDCIPLAEDYDLVVMSNVAGGWLDARPGTPEAKWRDMIRAPEAILDARTAYLVRESDTERAAFAAMLGRAGFVVAPVKGTTLFHLRRPR